MPTYTELRNAALDYLRGSHIDNQINLSGNSGVRRFFDQRFPSGLRDTDGHNICDIFHELASEGIISPGTGGLQGGTQFMHWPFFRITEYGRKALAANGYVPHDPDGYLRKFTTEFAAADPIILQYLEEGLLCMSRGFLRAAPVMLGCAAEKAMLILIETFRDAISDAGKKAAFEKDIKSWMISKKYEALWDKLNAIQGSLPGPLKDDLHTILDRTFDLIRTVRNDTGHPTGKKVDRDTVLANFIIFPVYYRRVFGLTYHYRTNPAVI
jgi:hypothetical protein